MIIKLLEKFARSLAITILALSLTACGDKPEKAVDILFTGGLMFDGSGANPVIADIGIEDGVITFIGDAKESAVTTGKTINIQGKWITSGFIDMHSHAELDKDYGRDGLTFLTQGVTTAVLGVDGSGSPAVGERLNIWKDRGIGLNALLYVGHGAVRKAVMGRDDRAPTADEMEAMKSLVRQAMEEGAFGLSSGLFYVPGSYANTEEVIELGKVAAEWDGAIYDTHDRDLGAVWQGIGYEASILEGIRITEESGLRGIFSHYNLQGRHNYGKADHSAELINSARERGVDIWAAQHPYTATQSSLSAYSIPRWASAGGQAAMNARFDDPETVRQIEAATIEMLSIRGGADKIQLIDSREGLNGVTLGDVARRLGLTPAETARELLRVGEVKVMNLELYDAENTRRLAREPWMMTCSDGRPPAPTQAISHPRAYGAFPMKMRLYTQEENLLEPSFIIRSFTGLAADFLGLKDRGYLKVGYKADIAVIDPSTFTDHATYQEPQKLSTGVVHLLVNGRFAIKDSEPTGALAGTGIRRGH